MAGAGLQADGRIRGSIQRSNTRVEVAGSLSRRSGTGMERCGAGELRGTVERRETRLNRDRVDSAANPDHGHAQSGSLKSIPEALEFCTPRATCFRTARLAPFPLTWNWLSSFLCRNF
jgi:hypothetical protein